MISGTFLGVEHMSKNKGGIGGVIVNISSAAGNTFNPLKSFIYKSDASAATRFWRSNVYVYV